MSVNIKQNGSLVKISGSSSWTGTRAEYEAIKDTIPTGSVVNITDDEDVKLVLPSEEQQVYSTDEIQIGTWIDGKPIYRKCYSINGTTGSTIQDIIIDENFIHKYNVDDVVDIKGIFKDSDSSRNETYWNGIQWSYISLTNQKTIEHLYFNRIYINSQNGNIIASCYEDGITRHFSEKLIIEYTKTTD